MRQASNSLLCSHCSLNSCNVYTLTYTIYLYTIFQLLTAIRYDSVFMYNVHEKSLLFNFIIMSREGWVTPFGVCLLFYRTSTNADYIHMPFTRSHSNDIDFFFFFCCALPYNNHKFCHWNFIRVTHFCFCLPAVLCECVMW